MDTLPKKSLQKTMLTIIVSLAILSLCVLLISSQLYKKYVIDREMAAVHSLMRIKVADIHSELSRYATELGIGLQAESRFRSAVRRNDKQKIASFLNDHFYQYYVTASIIDLKKISLLDVNYAYTHHSTVGGDTLAVDEPLCTNLTERAKNRTGADIIKPISGLCSKEGKSYYSVIVPVGTLSPMAYLQVTIDPTFNVPPLSTAINAPIRVSYSDGSLAYKSNDWPLLAQSDNFIFVNHIVTNLEDNPVYKIEVASNMEALQEGFRNTTYTVLLLSIVFIGVGIIIVIVVSKTSLHALRELSIAAKDTSHGQYHKIKKSGYAELDQVIRAFNIMSAKVTTHQDLLEKEIRVATEQLRNALDEVERRNKELETAIDMTEQANTTKNAFMANMSHELRTPLNAVIGYSEIVMEDLGDAGQNESCEDVKKINEAGKHLLEIVNNILDLSKIEAGKIELDLVSFDLQDIILQSIETVLPMANKKNIQISYEKSDRSLTIYSDSMRIKQVLINLINNAVKFTDLGGVDIGLEKGEYLGNPVYNIAIADTGVGIKKEEMDNLFKPFHQIDGSSTRRHDGTGLGLALSKQIIEGLGGAITLVSEYGKGSTFTIRIPEEFIL